MHEISTTMRNPGQVVTVIHTVGRRIDPDKEVTVMSDFSIWKLFSSLGLETALTLLPLLDTECVL